MSARSIFETIAEEENSISPTRQMFEEVAFSPDAEVGFQPSQKSVLEKIASSLGRGFLKGAQSFVSQAPFPRGPISPEASENIIEETIGPRGETFGEKALERGTEILPFLLGGEGSLVGKGLRTGLAALSGQAAENLGAGPLLQSLAEMSAFGLPGFSREISPTKAQKEILEFGRKKGLTEEQLALVLPKTKTQKFFQKIAKRGGKTERRLGDVAKGLENTFSNLFETGESLQLTPSHIEELEGNIGKKLLKMPASVRRTIQPDLDDLLATEMKASDLMNFWQDINANVNWGSLRGGKKQLGLLKESVSDALKDLSSDFAKDFELQNKLYSNYKNIYRSLKQRDIDKIINLGEIGSLAFGVITGNLPILKKILAFEGGRIAARELLINPRLQNLRNQMVKAVKENKITQLSRLNNAFLKELRKKHHDTFDDVEFKQD